MGVVGIGTQVAGRADGVAGGVGDEAQRSCTVESERRQRRRERAEEAERQAAERAEETTALLSKTILTINHRAGEDGKLFGSVTSAEIAEAIQAARGIKVDRKKIRLE